MILCCTRKYLNSTLIEETNVKKKVVLLRIPEKTAYFFQSRRGVAWLSDGLGSHTLNLIIQWYFMDNSSKTKADLQDGNLSD